MTQPPATYATAVGLLNKQVTIQRFAPAGTDARGQATGEWEALATVWANVMPLTGRWAEYAHQQWESATVRVLINYRADVTSACRLLFGSRVLAIGTATNLHEGNHTLELLCTEAKT